jgi:YHS domain-containing protein
MKADNSINKMEQAKTACGGTLKKTQGFPSAIYEGEPIYFCSQACLRVFQEQYFCSSNNSTGDFLSLGAVSFYWSAIFFARFQAHCK